MFVCHALHIFKSHLVFSCTNSTERLRAFVRLGVRVPSLLTRCVSTRFRNTTLSSQFRARKMSCINKYVSPLRVKPIFQPRKTTLSSRPGRLGNHSASWQRSHCQKNPPPARREHGARNKRVSKVG